MNASRLAALGEALRATGYQFVTVTPETHRRVLARTVHHEARTLRDVFGWSRAFRAEALPDEIRALADAAGVIEGSERLRSTVRFSTLSKHIFVHSAYPTTESDAVFFGPDTYRFCDFIARETRALPRVARAVDIGCGSGAGAIVAAAKAERIVFADVNANALAYAEANAILASVRDRSEFVTSDILASVSGEFDLALANPPYLVDPSTRTYRDGGGDFGEALGARIVREVIGRLAQRGRLLLYTGAAVIDGRDSFLEAVRPVLDASPVTWSYRELDPDVFGEEIEQNDAYAEVERIAAVALVATKA